MIRCWVVAGVTLSALTGIMPETAQAQASASSTDSSTLDLGREVLGVFADKCAACHGPDLAKPKGRFGYILDLKRLAGDAEKVVPTRPNESELWALVTHDEMPPSDSPHGPLTKEQKETVRAWIAAGASEALPPARELPETSSAALTLPALGMAESAGSKSRDVTPTELPRASRLFLLFGKFHLLLLHFPIALIVAAGFADLLSTCRRKTVPSGSARFCSWLAAIAAIPTVVLGWLFAAAGNGGGSPQLLTSHRWLGTAAAVWLVIAALSAEHDARRGARSHFARLLLVLGIFITATAAHLGGLLVHGADFFNY